jgi:hypothetical protein
MSLHSYKINNPADNNNKEMAVIPYCHTVETDRPSCDLPHTLILRIGRQYTDFVLGKKILAANTISKPTM